MEFPNHVGLMLHIFGISLNLTTNKNIFDSHHPFNFIYATCHLSYLLICVVPSLYTMSSHSEPECNQINYNIYSLSNDAYKPIDHHYKNWY